MSCSSVMEDGVGGGVSVVIPCRNEARHIAACLASVMANDFPHERLEVLVVDGASEDGTRAVVESFVGRYPEIHLLENPRQATPAALNIGIRAARFPIIMRMDAHSTYARDYIRRCEAALRTSGADNVGGVWVIAAQDGSPLSGAIGIALAHPFGVGNARYRFKATQPREVDTVPFGCYRRELFDRIGMFDENLRRGQDMDFNTRLRRAGGRIVLLPDVVSYYHPRTALGAFLAHNIRNGVWAVYPLRYQRVTFAPRHLVPGAFVGAFLGTWLAGLLWKPAWWLTATVAGSYLVALTAATADAFLRQRRVRLLMTLPLAFVGLHFAYGIGTLAGLLRVAVTWGFWRTIAAALQRRAAGRP